MNVRDRLTRLLFGATAEERAAMQTALADKRADARLAALASDLEAHFEEDVAAERAMANLASLRDVPEDVLPDGSSAHTALVWLISAGHDVYVYPAYRAVCAGLPAASWVVWLQPLADVREGKDGRVPLEMWNIYWSTLLAEMGLLRAATQAAAEGRVTA